MKKVKLIFVALAMVSLLLIACSETKFPTCEVKGKIEALGEIELEGNLSAQIVVWATNKAGNGPVVKGWRSGYYDKTWYFVGEKIPDSLLKTMVIIRYKAIDTNQGLFYAISVEKDPSYIDIILH